VIAEAFARRRAEGRATLIPYLTAGYPRRESTLPVLAAVARAGADVIELGIPFSDPLADGPTIQRASFRSLEEGTTVERVLADLAAFREEHAIPIVLFTYLNPVLRYGLEAFLDVATRAGANGLLLTDLPAGADAALEDAVLASPLDLIRLVAPTTLPARVVEIARRGAGFLYYISRTGVTGARDELPAGLAEEVTAIRSAVELPVAVGFGISTPAQAARVAALADGVVVGSALVSRLEGGDVSAAAEFVAALREVC
jgi:tryptophan synthase alpha chain